MNFQRKVFATTLGWYDLHTPDNGINTVAAEAARLEALLGVKLHAMKYHSFNHGYEVTFISDSLDSIKALCATDEGGNDGVASIEDGTIFEIQL